MRAVLFCFVVLLFLGSAAFANALVEIDGYVTDAANIFTPEEEAQLSAQLQTIFESGRIEFAVVTVPSLEGLPIEDYSMSIAQEKLGKTEGDNGLLLLIAPTERKYRFEVGRGLEGTLNDAKIGRVARTYIVPAFREEKYAAGVSQSITAVDQLIQGIEPATLEEDAAPFASRVWIALFILFVLVQIVASIAKKKRKNKYTDAAEAASWLFLRPPGGSGGFGGGSGGGGFGGGSFGGGGSSGGW